MALEQIDSIYYQPTPTVDSDHPDIIAFAWESASGTRDKVATAVALYYAVRDGIRYNPYQVVLSEDGFKASTTLTAGYAWCVPKAILLAAACRALGIAARLGFADVRNHLSTERMRQNMQTDVFLWHGYTDIWLNGRWVKATPAFNVELCHKFRLKPLEFDGRSDSIYHPFDLDGNRHMEYLHFRGDFADTPIDAIAADFREFYASLLDATEMADFDADVAQENF
jgi:transglutaminase-like putative cysteine protease